MNEISTTSRPAFLPAISKDKPKVGAELAKNYQRPTYFKIVQPQSGDELKDEWGIGTAIAVPDQKKIMEPGDVAHITPVFLYREFCIHNDYDSGLDDYIRERTFDENSEIARKCMSRNKEEWRWDENGSVAEHIDFAVIFHDHNEGFGVKPLIISFSVGSWKFGANFANLLDIVEAEAIYELRFQLAIRKEKYRNNTYYVPEVSIPETGGCYVTDEKLYHFGKDQYEKAKEAFDAGVLQGPNFEEDALKEEATSDFE